MEASWNPDGSVLLSWQPLSHTEAKGFPLYIVSYKSVDGSSKGSVSTTSSSVVISGLNSKISYIISVQVTTENGKNKGDTEYSKGYMVSSYCVQKQCLFHSPSLFSLVECSKTCKQQHCDCGSAIWRGSYWCGGCITGARNSVWSLQIEEMEEATYIN